MRIILRAILALSFWCLSSSTLSAAGFIEPSSTSDDGTIQLEWPPKGGNDTVYEVRRSDNDVFAESILVYEGQDTATFVSGLPEGEFHFKVRSKSPDTDYPNWTDESHVLIVEYTDPKVVAILMTAGFVTFVATVGAISIGHRKTKETS